MRIPEYEHLTIYPSSQKQKTPRMWGLINDE